ncbi:MAG: alpha-glucan family phosphorylase [Anaerolineales bacterium]
MVKPVATINVTPNLPDELARLSELAYNMRWSWDHDTIGLFRRLDPELWRQTDYNPIKLLGLLGQDRLNEVVQDPSFMTELGDVWDGFMRYMDDPNTWYRANYGDKPKPFIAYFSMEFGLATCLANYSGGLGILSGDHMKSASDLDLPLVGVGLLYQEGYFRQYLNASGYQQEAYPLNDYSRMPVLPVYPDGTNEGSERLVIKVPMAEYTLHAYVWEAKVGRVSLYLLDANHPDNPQPLRDLTDRLYGGDRRTRIRQEILLGIGGYRMLQALDIHPTVVHLNEGHSAFSALERTRILMKEHPNLSFDEARDILATGSVYTIHTPVPAGLERFGFDLIDEHFEWLWTELGLTRDEFHDLGREDMGGYDLFSLPVMALQFASGSNGVSQLHGDVSRQMWQWMFPDVPEDEVPVGAVTNGIHVLTWLSAEMALLYDRYLDPSWRKDPANPETWKDVERIPDTELWRTKERRRERMVAFARSRMRKQLIARGASQHEVAAAEGILNPDALTIGFARRFATYKRATLIFRDAERLIRMVNDPNRPVQFIFAGKAHPHDQPGKEFIKEIIEKTGIPELRNHIVFLENYDMTIGRYMVQGVDVWLNNPRRPKEASGTSGMKVIYNAGLNASILDGWWAEAYHPSLGWAIGKGEEYPPEQEELQDEIEANALYNLLETEIIPTFYNRGRDGLPREWVRMVKNSMRELAPFFTTYRMVRQYAEQYYMPAHERYAAITQPNIKPATAYAHWLENVKAEWKNVEVGDVQITAQQLPVGEQLTVKANVALGKLTPDDVRVQLYTGMLNSKGDIVEGEAYDMQPANGKQKGPRYDFEGMVSFDTSGDRGISVRVLPKHETLPDPFLTGYIRWANGK